MELTYRVQLIDEGEHVLSEEDWSVQDVGGALDAVYRTERYAKTLIAKAERDAEEEAYEKANECDNCFDPRNDHSGLKGACLFGDCDCQKFRKNTEDPHFAQREAEIAAIGGK